MVGKKDNAAKQLDDVFGPGMADLLKREEDKTRLVRTLEEARLKAGLTEAEVARRMGVSRSKVCRLEGAYDADLSWGDICAYAQAVGVSISLLFAETGNTAARIKHCVLEVGRLLRRLTELAKQANADESLTRGIDRFHRETLFNFLLQFDTSYKNLPRLEIDTRAQTQSDGKSPTAARHAKAAHLSTH